MDRGIQLWLYLDVSSSRLSTRKQASWDTSTLLQHNKTLEPVLVTEKGAAPSLLRHNIFFPQRKKMKKKKKVHQPVRNEGDLAGPQILPTCIDPIHQYKDSQFHQSPEW